MGLVATWLSGIGLSHAIPSFKAAGIVTPSALAELDLAHYEALGVTEPADRRKLFYLVQRIKMAVDQEEEPSVTHQQEVDNVLSKTLTSSTKLVLTEDDSLGDHDSVEMVEPPNREPDRRKSGRVTSTRQSMTTATTGETIENRRQKLSSRSRRASLTNGSTGAPLHPTRTSSKMKDDYDDADEQDDEEDSDWDSEESSIGADDELQERHATTAPRRMSSRLQEKKIKRDSHTSFDSSQQDEAPAVIGIRKGRTSTDSNGQSSRRQSTGNVTGMTATRRRSTSSNLDSCDESSSSGPSTRKKSSIPMHRGRRYESMIQNPGASTRTGKQLSTIPSESVAPMSPLVSLPVSRLDADISKQRQLEEKKAVSRKSTNARPSRPRTTSTGSQSGSDSDSRPSRVRSTSGSDSENIDNRRSGRQSLGSAGRQSSGLSRRSHVPQKSSSLRDLNTNEPSVDSTKIRGRNSLPAGVKTETETKGPFFVHGMPEDNSWGAQVAQLRADNQAEHELFAGHCLQSDDEQMRIRVIIRKRPMSTNEASSGKEIDVIHPLEYDDFGRVLVYQPKTRVDLTKEIEQIPFAFDNVFDESSNNVQIYVRSVRNLVPGVFEGKWASVFAYGQTGSGKTFTMMGSNLTGIKAGNSTNDNANLGLYYMAAVDVFELASRPEYTHMAVSASLFEIYGGKLFDLLNDRQPVKCLENHRGKVCFPGLSEHPVSNANELMDVIETGAMNRSTGSTSKNADSSRSHAVLQLSLRKDIGRQKNVEYGRLTFIDLAGSERGADTSKECRATRLEGAEINTSLLALKEVIRALATGDSMAHIPFRGSKLTQVLKESFVGKNSRSVMVACIAPNISNCEHTLNTLRYADRVKERNPETGNLSSNVANASTKGTRKLSRSSSVPVAIESSSANKSTLSSNDAEMDSFVSESQYESEDLLKSTLISNDAEVDSFVSESQYETEDPQNIESDKDYEPVSVEDSDTDLLDDLLRNTPHQARRKTQSNVRCVQPGSNKSETSSESHAGKVQFEALVATHRSVLTEMLGMVKHEMTLVNKADADRDTIDDYMQELDNLHSKQILLIHSLEDRLKDYYESRGTSGLSTAHAPAFGILDDDDSFEDLRDD